MVGKPGHGNKNAKGKTAGQLTRLQRNKAATIMQSSRDPLTIMLSNMMFWHDHAKNLEERIVAYLDELKAGGASIENVDFKKLEQLLKNHLDARNNSQSCAVDAAPYVHPRLASIAFKPNDNTEDEIVVIEAQLAEPTGGDTEDRSYRDDYVTVMPVVRKMAGK